RSFPTRRSADLGVIGTRRPYGAVRITLRSSELSIRRTYRQTRVTPFFLLLAARGLRYDTGISITGRRQNSWRHESSVRQRPRQPRRLHLPRGYPHTFAR